MTESFFCPPEEKLIFWNTQNVVILTSLLRIQGKSDFPDFTETWESDLPTFKRPSDDKCDSPQPTFSSLNSINFTDVNDICHFPAQFFPFLSFIWESS